MQQHADSKIWEARASPTIDAPILHSVSQQTPYKQTFGINERRGLCRAYYPVPLRCRAVGRILKIQAVRWGWLSGTVAVVIGAFILAIFLALFNYLTPP